MGDISLVTKKLKNTARMVTRIVSPISFLHRKISPGVLKKNISVVPSCHWRNVSSQHRLLMAEQRKGNAGHEHSNVG